MKKILKRLPRSITPADRKQIALIAPIAANKLMDLLVDMSSDFDITGGYPTKVQDDDEYNDHVLGCFVAASLLIALEDYKGLL